MNIGGTDLIGANFVNVLNTSGLVLGDPTDIAKLDDDGYFISAPAVNANISFPIGGNWSNTQYKLSWPSTLQFRVTFNTVLSSCSATNATVSGCAGVGTTTITSSPGQAGSVTFTVGVVGQWSVFFPTGATYSRSAGELALYRVSDEARYLAGEIFTAEYIALLQNLNPLGLRTMGWVNVGGNNFNAETDWRYRARTTNLGWQGRYPKAAYGGAVSGTDTYTAAAAPDTPAVWTDGELYVGTVANANTVAAPTIDIGGRGAKTIVTRYALALSTTGTISNERLNANSLGIFVYDAVLDQVVWSAVTLRASIPYEAHIQLANRVRANLWIVVPAMALDSYVGPLMVLVRDNLSGALYPYYEYSNEVWNPTFPQTNWSTARGAAFGFSASSNAQSYGYYGIRVNQIAAVAASFLGPRATRRARIAMAYQGAGDSSNIGNRFNGAPLAPSGVSTGQGNSVYNAFTGSANWTAFPNRPVDNSDVLSIAPYAGGQNLCAGPDIGCTTLYNASNVPFLQALVTAWEGGDQAASIAMIDEDVRIGRTLIQNVTGSGTTYTTPAPHGLSVNNRVVVRVTGGTGCSGLFMDRLYSVLSVPTSSTLTLQAYSGGFPAGAAVNCGTPGTGTMTIGLSTFNTLTRVASMMYQFLETNAALYDSARDGVGIPRLRNEQYEGNLEVAGPTAAQCTSLGITGTDCLGSINAAISAWKYSAAGRLTQTDYFKQYMGTDPTQLATFGVMPHSVSPSELVLMGIGSTMTASISGTTLTVTGAPSTGVAVGSVVRGNGVTDTVVVSNLTGTGLTGTYVVSVSQSVVSESMIISGPTAWSLIPDQFPTSTPYGLFFGVRDFNVNFLLKRDLDPAANDNTPVFINKAA